MKVEFFATANQKGQVVIPKKLRDDLNISDSVLLHILKRGNGFYVYPVKEVIGFDQNDASYLNVLIKTKGGWGDSVKISHSHELELKASTKRKTAW